MGNKQTPPTKQVRVIVDGLMDKLKTKVYEQFIDKHGLVLHDKDIMEVIAKAVMDEKLFAKIIPQQ